jgi:2-methylisocitrate lyase-like PEP mutase family enzyme
MPDLAAAALELRDMHHHTNPLILVNVWDVASAQRVVAAGGRAIGTSSAAIAECLGQPDDPTASIDATFDTLHRIASAVTVPVTADLLDGYGMTPEDLVGRLLAAGAVGCNLEDSDHATAGTLLNPSEVADRIAAVRTAATAAGVDIVVNARIDSYLHQGPDATADVIARGRRYLAAGADCVYPIRLTDPAVVRTLAGELEGPLNANLADAGTVDALAAAGASRISIGPTAFRRAYTTLAQLAADLLSTTSRD